MQYSKIAQGACSKALCEYATIQPRLSSLHQRTTGEALHMCGLICGLAYSVVYQIYLNLLFLS